MYLFIIYSQTSLIWAPKGQTHACVHPHYRGVHIKEAEIEWIVASFAAGELSVI